MTEITFRSDFTVDLVDQMGDDDSVLRAMLISTLKDDAVSEMSPEAKLGRIKFLMRGRHGTPFEHNSLTFRSEAPIVVYREWHRHRIGISINEQSGRYVELPPMFYLPPPERPVKQQGKPGAYSYVVGTDDDLRLVHGSLKLIANRAYFEYEQMLARGIAKEVARMCLPVNIYSSMYWTCNARSLMAFLSLRTRAEPYWQEWNSPIGTETFRKNPGGSMFPSTPMWEIEASALAMEAVFATAFPLTHQAFTEFGRMSP